MKCKVKVCGMRDAQNIQDVAGLVPDFMGFIFYEKSPRFVGVDFKMPTINKSINRVGVFVNHDFDFILKQVEKFDFGYVQLHGDESPELCHQLQSQSLKVIKAISVGPDFHFKSISQFTDCADYFLFDTKGGNYGGTGKTFDWSLLNKYKLPLPFFLSGGLSSENIDQVNSIESEFLYALDFNSGFETAPGIKDLPKLKNVFTQLQQTTKV